jgi:hypothetical protein
MHVAISSIGSRVWLFDPREETCGMMELTHSIKQCLERAHNISINVHNISDGCFVVASKKRTDDDIMFDYQKCRFMQDIKTAQMQ